MSYINPFSKYPISDGWAQHIARGSLGGIDFAMSVGTPVIAPTDGRLVNIQSGGSAGWYAQLFHTDGTNMRDEFLHLSKFVAEGYYKQGQTIGYSGGKAGAPGAGSSTGPHLHWHLILGNGRRVNPLDNLYGGGQVILAGWAGIQSYLSRHWGYTGPIDNVPGKFTWTAMQKFLKAEWGYRGVVDGAPGPLTWKSCQRWLARYYGYTGVCDGIPGPLTNAALQRAGAAIANQ